MSATEIAWSVNVWRDGAWAPHYGESGSRVGGRVDYAAAEKNVRKEFQARGRLGDVVRLSCRHLVIEHLNLDCLPTDEAKTAFFDDRVRGAAFPCGRCATLTTFKPLPSGSGLYTGKPLCGFDRCDHDDTPTKEDPQ